MNGQVPPFENGLDSGVRGIHRIAPATVVDMTYDEPTLAPFGPRTGHATTLGGGPARPSRIGSPALIPVEWDEESDTQVMGARHVAATAAASLELDWDNDDSNTEKWSPRHAPQVRAAQSRIVPKQAPAPLRQSDDVIEELREQLIDVLERARISESRAVGLERNLQEADKARSALATLRSQFSVMIERARNSEAQRAAAERRADEGEQEAEAALERLSQQLAGTVHEAQLMAAHANEAEQRMLRAEQGLQHARAERHVLEETTARALRRASARSVVMSLLSFGLLFACAALAYFLVYAPLQQKLHAQRELNGLAIARQSQELASLQARHDAEREQFDAERRKLEARLAAATLGSAPSAATARARVPVLQAAPAVPAAHVSGSAGHSHHAKAKPGDTPSAAASDAEPAAPRARSHADDDARENDPLDGL